MTKLPKGKIINLRSTSMDLNPKIPAPGNRPRCTVQGCNHPRAIIAAQKDGSPYYRKVCQNHHRKNLAKKHGVKTVVEITARRAGFSSVIKFKNSRHPYRRHRKDYCENQDGRLGFKCTTNVFWEGMLDVDHKNGNPADNRRRNLQTLCKCCHAYKTHKNGDTHTPGRGSLKRKVIV